MPIKHNLAKVLEELDTTRNKIAVESKTRPATLLDMNEGKTKRLELETVERILNVINDIAAEKGIDKVYTLNDLFTYEKDASN